VTGHRRRVRSRAERFERTPAQVGEGDILPRTSNSSSTNPKPPSTPLSEDAIAVGAGENKRASARSLSLTPLIFEAILKYLVMTSAVVQNSSSRLPRGRVERFAGAYRESLPRWRSPSPVSFDSRGPENALSTLVSFGRGVSPLSFSVRRPHSQHHSRYHLGHPPKIPARWSPTFFSSIPHNSREVGTSASL